MKTHVYATTVGAPWGPVHVAATHRGLAAIELMTIPDEFTAGLRHRFGDPVTWMQPDDGRDDGNEDARAASYLRDARTALAAALAGDPAGMANLASLPVDLDDRPAWDRAVLGAVREIPRGETRSYGEIARVIGRVGAARAVGGAVGRNPVALAIPCHRVIAGDGTLGGYGGGWWGDRERLLDLKEELLATEGIRVPRRPSRLRSGR